MDVDVGGDDGELDFDSDPEPAPKKTTARGKKAAPAKKAPAKKAPAKRGKKAVVSNSGFCYPYFCSL